MNSEKEAENLLHNFSNRYDFEKLETCVLFDVPFTEFPYALRALEEVSPIFCPMLLLNTMSVLPPSKIEVLAFKESIRFLRSLTVVWAYRNR